MRIVLTGGGTGGHIVPNLAVIEELKKRGSHELLYIGSKDGPEGPMLKKVGVEFEFVACGKLRRYFSLSNFKDAFKVPLGMWQARRILKGFKPRVVFSKGGFVSFPVVVAAWSLKIPVVTHESDVQPGLANRLSFKFSEKICISFEETREYLKHHLRKVVFTGNPVRRSVLKGEKGAGWKFTGLEPGRKPVVLIMGGSQGAMQINNLVKSSLEELLKRFQVVHLVGRGNLDFAVRKKGYVQYEYLDEQLKDIYQICEMVVSRGGANSLSELAALNKKVLVLPLGRAGSRGDQIVNAEIFAKHLGWKVLEGKVSHDYFVAAVEMLNLAKVKDTQWFKNGADEITDLILKVAE